MREFWLSHYSTLLKAGWKMQEIDQMDAMGYLEVLGWQLGGGERETTIDQVGVFGLGVT